MKGPLYFILLLLVSLAFAGGACHRHGEAWDAMSRAEHLMEGHPDSALAILDSIPADHLNGGEERARHALLLSMALDKNYVDLTTLDTLQPAIDYYLRHGSPDDKLRTYYYQARIYQNQGNDDEAMKALLKARDLAPHITDSLTYAKLLVMQSSYFVLQYRPNEYVENNLEAAKIYNHLKKRNQELLAYSRVINGYILLEDTSGVENTFRICDSLKTSYNVELPEYFTIYRLTYLNEYGTQEQIQSFLNDTLNGDSENLNLNLEKAQAYARIGDFSSATQYMERAQGPMSLADSLKAGAIAVSIFENKGDYQEAYRAYVEFSEKLSVYQAVLLKAGALSEEQKHKAELDKLYALKKKDRILWACASFALLLVLVGGLVYYRYRMMRAKNLLAEKEQQRLLEEKENEKEIAALEKQKNSMAFGQLNSELRSLISTQQKYEEQTEFLNEQNKRLLSEIDLLKDLLNDKTETEKTIRDAFRARLSMLNGLLATEISNNQKHSKKCNRWLKDIHDHKAAFLRSTRLVFTASHPAFIEYLEKVGLSKDEIEYLCLFGLGLNGKEIGGFMGDKYYYATSGNIRKKLNLTEQDLHLANFIRSKLEEEENK